MQHHIPKLIYVQNAILSLQENKSMLTKAEELTDLKRNTAWINFPKVILDNFWANFLHHSARLALFVFIL